jgi:hypothetical protein
MATLPEVAGKISRSALPGPTGIRIVPIANPILKLSSDSCRRRRGHDRPKSLRIRHFGCGSCACRGRGVGRLLKVSGRLVLTNNADNGLFFQVNQASVD